MTDDTKLVPVRIVVAIPDGPSGQMAHGHVHHAEPGHDPHVFETMSNIGLGGSHIWWVVDGEVELVVDLRPALEELGNAALIKHETGAMYLRPDGGDWSGVPLPPGIAVGDTLKWLQGE